MIVLTRVLCCVGWTKRCKDGDAVKCAFVTVIDGLHREQVDELNTGKSVDHSHRNCCQNCHFTRTCGSRYRYSWIAGNGFLACSWHFRRVLNSSKLNQHIACKLPCCDQHTELFLNFCLNSHKKNQSQPTLFVSLYLEVLSYKFRPVMAIITLL
jgi:hypothetical protein